MLFKISQQDGPCELHTVHTPITLVNEQHHILPEYMQKEIWSKTMDQRKANVCATGHNSVHYAIQQFQKTGAWPTNVVGKTRDLAQEAIKRFNAAKADPQGYLKNIGVV